MKVFLNKLHIPICSPHSFALSGLSMTFSPLQLHTTACIQKSVNDYGFCFSAICTANFANFADNCSSPGNRMLQICNQSAQVIKI